jgi:23S rRNA pseudouridine955/2504/2580 synthase
MKRNINVSSIVSDKDHGQRLDLYLSKRFTYLSRNAWQQEIKKSKIIVNNMTVKSPHKKIMEGDEIIYTGRNLQEPPVDKSYTVLYEDNFYIALHKSGDLPVHPSGRYLSNSLTMIIKKDLGFSVYPVHRIDRETSGVILLAKSSEAVSLISRTFSMSKKTYLTIVKGNPTQRSFTIDTPLGPDHNSKIRKKRAAYNEATEKAITHFVKVLTIKDHTLLKATLETGRLHQVRAHLESADLPILGDKIYGGNENFYLEFIKDEVDENLFERIGFTRCALHSRSLTFYHPYKKKTVRIIAPLHPDMKEFLLTKE